MSHIPLVPYHIQEVAVINDSLKNGSESQTIMATEGSRKPDYGNRVRQSGRLNCTVRMEDVWIKLRQEFTVTENK